MAGSLAANLVMDRAPRSAAAEAFRSLRTSLQFLGPEKTRVFVVTSPGPAEGKSTCVANLGMALASAGKRVLIVDADMRRPTMQDLFGLGQVQGLSNLLIGQCGDDAVQESGVQGLSVLASGRVPPNPSELLDTERFDQALARWIAHYDHVLLDSPPVLAVTDAVVIGRRVRRALLVTRAGTTRDKTLQRAVSVLREAGVEIVGTVLNDLSAGNGEYGYYQGSYEYQPKGPGMGAGADREG